jgi:hypothetical protein
MGCVETQLHTSEEVTLPPKIPIPEPMVEIIKDVTTRGPDAYFPSESRSADTDVHTPEAAYRQITKLYPKKTTRIACWTEFNNHFIFSLGHTEKIKTAYLYILYIRKGDRKFGYFWPHT